MVDEPTDIEAQRDRLIAEIYDAFRDASREGGVSWSEAHIMDNYGKKRGIGAHFADKDVRWQELVDDPLWHDADEDTTLPFQYFDPIGARYYLPAVMIRGIRAGDYYWLSLYLIAGSPNADPRERESLREHSLHHWSLLDLAQRRSVRHFIEYMIAVATPEERFSIELKGDWEDALQSYWHEIPEAPEPPAE